MECPKCNKKINKVIVNSSCWQYGTLVKDEIVDYGPMEEIGETNSIECPECFNNISAYVHAT